MSVAGTPALHDARGERRLPRIDLHVHLAGVGTQRSGCWMSARFRRRFSFLGLRLLYGLTPRQLETTADQDWAALVAGSVADSELDLAVVLGFDGVYDVSGRFDPARSQLVVPPAWVFEVCERFGKLAPGPSINPLRRDALDLLEESIERGAVLVKWLPATQDFDPGSPRAGAFLRRLAESGTPLLVHAGSGELTFRTLDPHAGDLPRLIPALESGVTVICAHSAARIHGSRDPDQLPLLRALLERYPNLWVDNSGLANPGRCLHLPRLAGDPLLRERTLHGSDFPVPSDAVYYARELPVRAILAIEAERNKLQRDAILKRRLGYPEASLTRAAGILANLGRWYSPPRRLSGGGQAPLA